MSADDARTLLEQVTGVVIPLERTPDPEVLRTLDVGGREKLPRPTLRNVIQILERDRRWSDRVRLNEFAGTVEYREDRQSPYRLIRDEDEVGVYRWLAEVYRLDVSTQKVSEALRYLARARGYHPVQEYLSGLTWDGRPRLERLLSDYFRGSPSPLLGALGRCWLVSCCARVYQPGCKVDTVLILAGDQGLGKSRGLRAMVPTSKWFSDSAIDFHSKDAYQVLNGIWLYELAELDSLRRRDASAVKAFLSSPENNYRPSYGRNTVHVPRQTVFVGTTNEAEFLSDPTGSRRFWPVEVSSAVDVAAIERDRDQLWAEAITLYLSGEPWWLDPDADRVLREESEIFRQVDAWEEAVGKWASGLGPSGYRTEFTVAEVLEGALGRKPEVQTRGDAMRVATILKAQGYRKTRARRGGPEKVQIWSRP